METNAKTTGSSGSQPQSETDGLNLGNLTEMLGGVDAAELLKKYCGPATKMLGKLTTTQKIIGGAVLLLGAGYLAKKSRGKTNFGKKNR